MSKKKPEKSRKRSKALLKGVVTAGAVIGGVDIFSDANVVYAAELDETGIATNDEVVVETEMSLAQEAAEALETEESTTAAETESTNNVEEVQEQENNELEDTTTPTEEEIPTEENTEETSEDSLGTEEDTSSTETDETSADSSEDTDSASEDSAASSETSEIDSESQEDVTSTEAEEESGSESEETSTETSEDSASDSESEESESVSQESEEGSDSASGTDSLSTSSEESGSTSEGSLSTSDSESGSTSIDSLSISTSESVSADAKDELTSESMVFDVARFQMLSAKAASGKLTAEEDEELKNLLSESASASTALDSTMDSVSEASTSASDSLSTEASGVASTSESASTFVSESLHTSQSTEDSLNASMLEAVSQAQSEYGSLLEHYKDGEQRLERLEALKKLIDAQEEVVERIRSKDAGKFSLSGNPQLSEDYWSEADKLANMLIQYKMLSEAQVNDFKEVSFSNDGKWIKYDKNGTTEEITGNYIEVKYQDANGQEQIRYFDYVTADENGNALSSNNRGNAKKVKYIYIVEMTKNDDGKFIVNKRICIKVARNILARRIL